jgi:hypothetical protein
VETKIIHRKLGRERALGQAYFDEKKIELDERLSGYRYMLYLLHEHYHIQHPDWSETKVIKESRATAKILWRQNFRWVDIK